MLKQRRFINDERMEIVIFTLPINVIYKSHDCMAHFPRIQTCMLTEGEVWPVKLV